MNYSVLIRDNENKLCEKILYINGDREEHITNNIAIIQRTGKDVNMHSIDHNYSIQSMLDKGWKEEVGLYDKLVVNHNSLGIEIIKF